MTVICNYFWGSHGCSLPMGDHTAHQCGVDEDGSTCSQHDEVAQKRRYASRNDDDETEYEWSEWMDAGPGWRQ